jgi:hypothetical protein
MEPAAIRHKNPGAMWPGPTATKWGSTKWVYLNDGTGQGGNGKGNKIATFDSWQDGLCAQIDLWRGPRYRNKTFAAAIAVWSGGNNVPAYIAWMTARIPGLKRDTVIDDAFLNSPTGAAFLKYQAWHEAGKRMPYPDSDIVAAQKRVFGGAKSSNGKKAAGSIAGGVASGTAAATEGGFSPGVALMIGVAVALAIFVVWKLTHKPTAPAAPTPAPDVQPEHTSGVLTPATPTDNAGSEAPRNE